METWRRFWNEKKEEIIIGAIMRSVISILFTGVAGAIAFMASSDIGMSLLLAVLLGIAVLLLLFLPRLDAMFKEAETIRYREEAAERIKQNIASLPTNGDDKMWSSWLNITEMALRGFGGLAGTNIKAKVKILRDNLTNMPIGDRAKAAKAFLDSLAFEVTAPESAKNSAR